jgi:hypothetical protein
MVARYASPVNGSEPVDTAAPSRLTTARCFGLAFASSAIVAIVIVATAVNRGDGVSALVVPGERGPSISVFRHDFPHTRFAADAGTDGQQFYAIARQPMHLEAVAPALDRPRYRLQRILLPVLAWAVQPQGGGPGLVIAMFIFAALGAVAVGFGGAWLLDALGAPETITARAALILPIFPGVVASVGLAIPDALALGLALVAIALDVRGRLRAAVFVAVLAVLARETILLVFLGWLLWRGRRAIWLLVAPGVAAATWWFVVRLTVPAAAYRVHEFEPIRGLIRAAREWAGGSDLAAAAVVLVSFGLGLLACRRTGLRSPLGPAIAIQMLFLLCLDPDVIGLSWNATRATLPLMVIAALALMSTSTTQLSERPAATERLAEPGIPGSRRGDGDAEQPDDLRQDEQP